MFASIISAIIAIAKAVPALNELVDKFVEAYISSKINAIDAKVISIRDERTVLLKQISGAKNNEERRALSITLARIR